MQKLLKTNILEVGTATTEALTLAVKKGDLEMQPIFITILEPGDPAAGKLLLHSTFIRKTWARDGGRLVEVIWNLDLVRPESSFNPAEVEFEKELLLETRRSSVSAKFSLFWTTAAGRAIDSEVRAALRRFPRATGENSTYVKGISLSNDFYFQIPFRTSSDKELAAAVDAMKGVFSAINRWFSKPVGLNESDIDAFYFDGKPFKLQAPEARVTSESLFEVRAD